MTLHVVNTAKNVSQNETCPGQNVSNFNIIIFKRKQVLSKDIGLLNDVDARRRHLTCLREDLENTSNIETTMYSAEATNNTGAQKART